MESPRVDHTHMERNLHDPYCSLDGKAPPILLVKTLQKSVIVCGTCFWLGHTLAQDSVGMPCQEFSPHCLWRSLCQACCETGHRTGCSPLDGSCLLFWVRFWQGPSGSFVYCQACGAVIGCSSQWCPVCSAWLVAGFWLVVRECHPVVSARSLACLYSLQCFAPPVGFAAFTAAIWAVRFRVVVWPTAWHTARWQSQSNAVWPPGCRPLWATYTNLAVARGTPGVCCCNLVPVGSLVYWRCNSCFSRPLFKPSDFCLRLFRCLLVWGSALMSPSLAFWGAPFHAPPSI